LLLSPPRTDRPRSVMRAGFRSRPSQRHSSRLGRFNSIQISFPPVQSHAFSTLVHPVVHNPHRLVHHLSVSHQHLIGLTPYPLITSHPLITSASAFNRSISFWSPLYGALVLSSVKAGFQWLRSLAALATHALHTQYASSSGRLVLARTGRVGWLDVSSSFRQRG
jgi:hypothetical protein